MGERPDRPDEVRRDPLDRQDALSEGGRDAYPLTYPAGTPEEPRPVGSDPPSVVVSAAERWVTKGSRPTPRSSAPGPISKGLGPT
jgi:hypothetical protein